jgi:hypothetical protein
MTIIDLSRNEEQISADQKFEVVANRRTTVERQRAQTFRMHIPILLRPANEQ